MPKIIDKMRELMFGEYDEDEDEYVDSQEEVSYEKEKPAFQREAMDYTSIQRAGRRNNSQVVSIHTNVQMQVVIIKPECYEDAQEICDQVKDKKPVVVNLEKVEYPIAQRIMDFLSGTCYSLDGSIQRVANNIFIIAPQNVDISGDFKEELKTKGIILPWVSSAK